MNKIEFPPKFKKIRNATVFCSARIPNNPLFMKVAEDLGRFLGTHHIQLVYGGSDCGLMGTVAKSTIANGGDVFGISPEIFDDEKNNIDTINIKVKDLAERKKDMLKLSHVIIALPGGFGTLDELYEALTLRQIKMPRHNYAIGLLNIDGYYDYTIKQIEVALKNGLLKEEDLNILQCANTIEELFVKLANAMPD